MGGLSRERRLSDIIPDPEARAFIRRIYHELGTDWAAELTRCIADGTLVYCADDAPDVAGPVSRPAYEQGWLI